jgi:SAM-dependent methyltransferase
MTALLPSLEQTDDIRRLRLVLRDAAFSADSVQDLLRTEGELITRPAELPLHLRRLRNDDSACATLVKLFILGVTMERKRADTALAPFGVDLLERLQLVREDEGGIRGVIRLVPHDDLVIASDRPDEDTGADHVAGIHRPSATLANLTVRRAVDLVLDVGTGNGIQAILAARHANRVVATDLNARALVFARLNAALNGVTNIEFREGSFLEPVAGERFDLIVANPPYVISPESEFLFRDSGLGGDRVSEQLVRDLPDHLAEDGFATVMVSWIQEGDDPAVRPSEWIADRGCDAWVFHSRTDDVLTTASLWNRDAKTSDEYAERIDRWTDYYSSEGITSVAYGGLVLRRRSGSDNWIRSTELPAGRLAAAGAHLERMFAGQDVVATADDEQLLGMRFAFAGDVAVEQDLKPGADAWTATEVTLKLTDGIGFRAGLDEITTRVVLRLTPTIALGDCLDGVAAELDLQRGQLRQAGAELVRRLLALGFVVAR